MNNLIQNILEADYQKTKKKNNVYKNIVKNHFDSVRIINELFEYLATWNESSHKNIMLHYGGKEYIQFLFSSLINELEEFKKLVNDEMEK